VHFGLSLAWGIALAHVLPRRKAMVFGAAGGLAIAALDLGVLGRGNPRIRGLAPLPQLADHVAFGAVVGAVLARTRT